MNHVSYVYMHYTYIKIHIIYYIIYVTYLYTLCNYYLLKYLSALGGQVQKSVLNLSAKRTAGQKQELIFQFVWSQNC